MKLPSLWKHTKSGKFKSYGIDHRVFYEKARVLKSLIQIK